MIHFHTAKFTNFVVLRDVSLDFSIDPERPVTVLRASNGTGKTTCLRALEWALYGDEALPSANFQIQPVDWSEADGPVEVEVQIEFSHTSSEPRPGGQPTEKTTRYRLSRKATVSRAKSGRSTRPPTLMRLKESQGWEPVQEPAPIIGRLLPFDLREFFFTDGDKAMTYVSAGSSTRTSREARASRVEGAVRALLGLELVEGTADRVAATATKLRREANRNSGAELGQLERELQELEDAITRTESGLDDATSELATLTNTLAELTERRDRELMRGDAEQLKADLTSAEADVHRLRVTMDQAEAATVELVTSPHLSTAMFQPVLRMAREKLAPLNERGVIPASHLQLIREVLRRGECLCGSDVSRAGPLRSAVESVLTASEQEAEGAARLGELYYEAGRLIDSSTAEAHWPTLLARATRQDENLRQMELQAVRRKSGLEDQLKHVDSEALRMLSTQIAETQRGLTEKNQRFAQLSAELPALTKSRDAKAQQYRSEARKQGDQDGLLAAMTVAQDLKEILGRTMETLKSEKVDEVSEEMNRLFLQMIVADRSPGHDNIARVELTQDFQIRAEAPGGKRLDPDHELNGASRRALTVSFVLALSKVAKVGAPNVIDTPLGMTSGEVRRAVFEVSARESSQLILFLTRDETASIEDLLDQYVGESRTLTNQAHYPNRIVNRTSDYTEVMVCECDHRQYCTTCERVDDAVLSGLQRRA